MEGEMGREVAVWWGPDSILSALGFGTRENMEAVRAGRTNLSVWHDGTPVCGSTRNGLRSWRRSGQWRNTRPRNDWRC